jgi:hypothetical protein
MDGLVHEIAFFPCSLLRTVEVGAHTMAQCAAMNENGYRHLAFFLTVLADAPLNRNPSARCPPNPIFTQWGAFQGHHAQNPHRNGGCPL